VNVLERLKQYIVQTLYNDIFPILKNEKISLFLIGARASDKTSLRYNLRTHLEKKPFFRNHFEIFYPEEIFADLLYNSKVDLLKLENLLAQSVHALIICVESFGSIAELGAFSNHMELSKKLIVVTNIKHKKDKSFIRNGPIRYIEDNNINNSVIWYGTDDNIEIIANKVQTIAGKVGKSSAIERNLHNPIVVADFLLIIIFTLGQLSREEIVNYVKELEPDDLNKVETICGSALNTLFKQRSVFLQDKKYVLTRTGYDRLLEALPKKKGEVMAKIDDLRTKFLNKSLRKCI
jgi:hypothetical protein